MLYDVAIVGGGPAGLSSAIRLKQLGKQYGKDVSVCVLEKGQEVGNHVLSGNVFNPVALDELIPSWRSKGCPITSPVIADEFHWLVNQEKSIKIPDMLIPMSNEGNYIISLGRLCRWLGEQAEELEVDIFPATAAAEILYTGKDKSMVKGVRTGEMGLNKEGKPTDEYCEGIDIIAKQTLFAEGARGSLSEQLISHFHLRDNCQDQTYGLGIKEIWKVKPEKFQKGLVKHSVGWPLDHNVYGGTFEYHMEDDQVLIGLIAGLDYNNPHISIFKELQAFKTHSSLSSLLEGGECIGYGARVINEGGYQSIPDLSFPGGGLIGCSAGFVNVPKIKGSHYAMKTGMVAAEEVFDLISKSGNYSTNSFENEIASFRSELDKTYVIKDLYEVRNIRPFFENHFHFGMMFSGTELWAQKLGIDMWDMKHRTQKDSERTLKVADLPAGMEEKLKKKYAKPDGKLTFDILTQVSLTNTYHEEEEPCHLKIKPQFEEFVAEGRSLSEYGGPERGFCPANVYEYVYDEKLGRDKLKINSQNCIHCKCCSIKMPHEYIDWTVPQGGSGPNYEAM